MSKNPLVDTLIQLCGDDVPIVIHRSVVEFTGSIEAAMMFNQLLYWTPRATLRIPNQAGTWIARTDAQWADELYGLSRYGVRKARQRLIDMGILRIERYLFSGAPTTHYQVDVETLSEKWSAWVSSRAQPPKAQSQPLQGPLFEIEQCPPPAAADPLSEFEQCLPTTITEPLSEIEQCPPLATHPLSENAQTFVRNQTDHCPNSDRPLFENAQSITEITTETTTEITAESEDGEEVFPKKSGAIAPPPQQSKTAVQIFRHLTGWNPKMGVRKVIAECVGEAPRRKAVWWAFISWALGEDWAYRHVNNYLAAFAQVLSYPEPDAAAALAHWARDRKKNRYHGRAYIPPQDYAQTSYQERVREPQPPEPPEVLLWEKAKSIVQLKMLRATFDKHIHGTRFSGKQGNTWHIQARNPLSIDWLDSTLRPLLERAAAETAGREIALHFVPEQTAAQAVKGAV